MRSGSSKFLGLLAFSILVAPTAGSVALVIIDVQDCFLEHGTLPVQASHIIPVINNLRKKTCAYDLIVRSQDFHPSGHMSFASTWGGDAFTTMPMKCIRPSSNLTKDAACCSANQTKGAKMPNNPACKTCFGANASGCFDYTQTLWPDHCLQDGDSTFPTNLTTSASDKIIQKGTNVNVDAYSVFMDNSKFLKTDAEKLFKDNGVTEAYFVGIATEYCVYHSILDAITLGFKATLITDAVAGLNDEDIKTAKADLLAKGATFMTSAEFIASGCVGTTTTTTQEGNAQISWAAPRSSSATAFLLASMVVLATFFH